MGVISILFYWLGEPSPLLSPPPPLSFYSLFFPGYSIFFGLLAEQDFYARFCFWLLCLSFRAGSWSFREIWRLREATFGFLGEGGEVFQFRDGSQNLQQYDTLCIFPHLFQVNNIRCQESREKISHELVLFEFDFEFLEKFVGPGGGGLLIHMVELSLVVSFFLSSIQSASQPDQAKAPQNHPPICVQQFEKGFDLTYVFRWTLPPRNPHQRVYYINNAPTRLSSQRLGFS